ncbi:MAG: AsnC family transcriptional regulator [Thiohalophilus sp.]|uniref:siroheme decarboxylase subunit beta n=1 Tax=Thiohalophilus sp. TaxID=3028392 RepID=UPI0028704928|nr:AsnC family transcriptional regulator [Thiohalophilus sp.]MDR9437139.1 AsnC family transcriptional regulator [Thiohalophilus sp.]
MQALKDDKVSMLDETDRRIILATQDGLPLERRPYEAVARKLGISAEEVMHRLRRMSDEGIVRRIAAVPNHYKLGYTANGMSVWNVPDEHVEALGKQVGALEFVSHCYRRPRHLPAWPYNLFAMVHATSREEALEKVGEIARLLGDNDRGHDVLFSRRILKKTGMRLTP